MQKTAIIFPGQGSQEIGMGRKYFEEYESAKKVFTKLTDVFGFNTEKLCFETDNIELSKTINSQPAIFTVSMAMLEIAKQKGITFEGVCGFSLGEVCALVAGGVYSLIDGGIVLAKRAKAMQKSAENSVGGMAAIIGLDNEVVENVCNKTEGYVECVNYNCPKQVVIAGEEKALELAMEDCKNLKAMKVVRLDVNAAFHSKLMQDASKEFYNQIRPVKTSTAKIDIYTNVTADKLDPKTDIAAYLQKQMVSPVLFTKCIQKMIEDGYTKFIEMGNGKVLSGLVKRINREVQIVHFSDLCN